MMKALGIFVAFLILALGTFIWFRFYKDFADGYRAGTLNYVVRKGYIWKTYEGELIQAGMKSKAAGTLQSNEFVFSIGDEAVARKLELASGHEVQIHYREYSGALPWRGYSKFVVDSVVSIDGK
jgi:hypothetical protein